MYNNVMIISSLRYVTTTGHRENDGNKNNFLNEK